MSGKRGSNPRPSAWEADALKASKGYAFERNHLSYSLLVSMFSVRNYFLSFPVYDMVYMMQNKTG